MYNSQTVNFSFQILRIFSGGVAVNSSVYGEGTGHIWMNSLECSGTEDFLQNCIFTSCGDVMCTHSQDAAVSCTVIGKYLHFHCVYLQCFHLKSSFHLSRDLDHAFGWTIVYVSQ